MTMAVLWGLAHRSLDGIEAIGVDEIQWQKGHKYLTLVYQIEQALQAVAVDRAGTHRKTFLGFFRDVGRVSRPDLQFICSDMWKPYLKVIAEEGRAGGPRSGPLPHHGPDEQGHR